jgi:hypothetical protein
MSSPLGIDDKLYRPSVSWRTFKSVLDSTLAQMKNALLHLIR